MNSKALYLFSKEVKTIIKQQLMESQYFCYRFLTRKNNELN